jgi:hypothetical protein
MELTMVMSKCQAAVCLLMAGVILTMVGCAGASNRLAEPKPHSLLAASHSATLPMLDRLAILRQRWSEASTMEQRRQVCFDAIEMGVLAEGEQMSWMSGVVAPDFYLVATGHDGRGVATVPLTAPSSAGRNRGCKPGEGWYLYVYVEVGPPQSSLSLNIRITHYYITNSPSAHPLALSDALTSDSRDEIYCALVFLSKRGGKLPQTLPSLDHEWYELGKTGLFFLGQHSREECELLEREFATFRKSW